jgi:hypothetical protein
MMLSYSFRTKTTSGFVKGTSSAKIEALLAQLAKCASTVSHPLLLPILALNREFSTEHDQRQREARNNIRQLEKALILRYNLSNPTPGHPGAAAAGERSPETDPQCEVLWKRPRAWQNAVRRLTEAMKSFWDTLESHNQGEVVPEELRELHHTLLSRLDFIATKLECLENYSAVTWERMNIQREVVSRIYQVTYITTTYY